MWLEMMQPIDKKLSGKLSTPILQDYHWRINFLKPHTKMCIYVSKVIGWYDAISIISGLKLACLRTPDGIFM